MDHIALAVRTATGSDTLAYARRLKTGVAALEADVERLEDKMATRVELPSDRGEVGRGADRDALSIVIPAKAGTCFNFNGFWIPACAGMTDSCRDPHPGPPLQGGGRRRGG